MKKLAIFIIFILAGVAAQASHILGGEIGYKHISGLNYEVQVNLYGDCSGGAFPSLFDATTITEVEVYNGGSLFTTISCTRTGEYGKEITPVCDKDSNNTTCRGGTIPGIAEFRFTAPVSLSGPSANWSFVFRGNLGGTAGAGRSSLITNMQASAGQNFSVIYLVATLNNTAGPNSSPELTTIPTPFFCVNQSQQYNVGAADSDGDLLSFSLINGLEINSLNNLVSVNYNAGFSGAQPLAASSFNFNGNTGQLTFVPNMTQVSLVVNKIEEYKNGVLVGSMMREMNFIVLNNCNNQSPSGAISATNVGVQTAPNEISVCNADSSISFSINVQDPDSGRVEATISGAPAGLNYTVNNNNTQNPTIDFDFNFPQPMEDGDSYSFFVTVQDDGCPLSSKQQIAFTLKVVNPITALPTVIDESCVPGRDGIINVSGSSLNGGLMYSFNGGPYQANNTFTGLVAGNYVVTLRDALGCFLSNNLRLDTSVEISLGAPIIEDISCFSKSDGRIQVSSSPSNLQTSYTLFPTNRVSPNGVFDNLASGTYTIIANAPLGCSDTTTATIISPPDISFQNIVLTENRCDQRTGRIEIGSNITRPVEYTISPNQQSNSTGAFGGLADGFYIVTVTDENGCYKDTLLEIKNNPAKLILSLSKQDVSCNGNGNDGSASVFVVGGVEPLTYSWVSQFGFEGNSPSVFDQRSGVKRVFVTDAIGCESNDYIMVDPANCCEKVFIPSAFSPNADGRNDDFNIRTPLTMTEVKLIVANRWGQIVWQTNNHLDSWDGNYEDGTEADVGTYYYFLRYQCASDKNTYKLKGDVTIIR